MTEQNQEQWSGQDRWVKAEKAGWTPEVGSVPPYSAEAWPSYAAYHVAFHLTAWSASLRFGVLTVDEAERAVRDLFAGLDADLAGLQ